jgi:hypothetical protein
MKVFGIVTLLAVGLLLIACGGGSNNNPNNINGNWTATLTNPDGTPAFAFTTSLTQNSSSSVTVANLQFNTSSDCFDATTTETASFNLSGNFNGNVTGGFGLTISTVSAATNNVLTLQGNMNGTTISGTWTLTGTSSGCTGSGSFKMTHT